MSFWLFFMSITSIHRKVGSHIRTLREGKSWLQRELAKKAGLPLRTIGRIERGEVDVRLSTIAKIAHSLGVSLKDLVQ